MACYRVLSSEDLLFRDPPHSLIAGGNMWLKIDIKYFSQGRYLVLCLFVFRKQEEEGEKERETLICCPTYLCNYCFLCVTWPEIKPATLVYQDDRPSNQLSCPARASSGFFIPNFLKAMKHTFSLTILRGKLMYDMKGILLVKGTYCFMYNLKWPFDEEEKIVWKLSFW